MKRTWLVLGIVLGVIGIGAAGYLGFSSGKPPAVEGTQAPDTVAVSRCDVTQTVTAPGTTFYSREVTLHSPLGAIVDELLVRPGDPVRAGQPLLTFSQDGVALALAEAQVAVVQAQDALDEATGSRAGLNYARASDLTLEQARLRYAAAEKALDLAQGEYDQVAGLPASNPIRFMALERLLAAKQGRDQALISLNWYTGHPSGQAIAAADAQVALAQARLAAARSTLALLESTFASDDGVASSLKAPFDGVVVEVQAQAGEPAAAGSALLVLVDPRQVEVEATVVEEDFPYVSAGQEVELFFDALPDAQARGTVERILPERASGDRPLYYVYIRVERVPEHLVDGMTADAAILIAQRSQVLCLPRALVHASSGSTAAVTVWNGASTETRQIEIGLRGDVYVEILSGLEQGEQVVTR